MSSEWISICFRTAIRGDFAIFMVRISGCSETADPMAPSMRNGHLEREGAMQRRFIFQSDPLLIAIIRVHCH